MNLETLLLFTLEPSVFTENAEHRKEVVECAKPAWISTGAVTGASSTSTTALTITSGILSQQASVEYNKSLNTYIESMSDEELEIALTKYNLLEKDNSIQRLSK